MKRRTLVTSIIIFFVLASFSPTFAFASDFDYIRGTITDQRETISPNSINPEPVRMVTVRTRQGIFEAENELGVLNIGDKVIIKSELVPNEDGTNNEQVYSIYERDRSLPLIVLGITFMLAVLMLGFKQGVRALSALVGTLFVIFNIYIPSLLAGFSPVTTSIVLGLLIAGSAVFITHGFRRSTIVAYASTVTSVLVAVVIAIIAIHASKLVGVTSDEVVYLANTSTHALDLAGIMIGGIIITMLGVLDDIAITQVAVIEELKKSNPAAAARELYVSALRVGRDHAGALVNTLVLAYTGTALPLLLLLKSQDIGLLITLNQEQFAYEIIRSLSGSIGLVACVPIATYLAVRFLPAHSHDEPVAGCPHCMSQVSRK